MSYDHKEDIITLVEVVKRIPPVLKKLPRVVRGLMYAYDRDPSHPMGLAWAFEKAAQKNPKGLAVAFEEARYSYHDFNRYSNQIAHFFLSKGLQKGDVVCVLIENRPELLATVLGLAKIGVVSALVNTSQRGKVLVHSVNLVKPKGMIVGEELQDVVLEVLPQLALNGEAPFWFADTGNTQQTNAPAEFINLGDRIAPFPRFNPNTTQHVHHSDGLFYIYTSGTTGLPKAVIFSNGRWMKAYGTFGHIMNLNKNDVMYSTLPLYHATGMVIAWSCAIVGTSGFAIRRKFSTREFWSDVQKFNASAICYVGELCRYLMETPESSMDRTHRVTKMIGNGMRPNIWGKFKDRFGIVEMVELYGSSEGNVGFRNIFNFDNTVGFSPTPYAIVEFDKENNVPIRGADGFMKKVAVGGVGLLLGEITEKSPFDGYTDPEKNKAVIFENVFKQGDKYFNTGDLIRDIGYRHAQFVDRVGDTFRWKGENVSTTEVENCVSEHPKVSEAVVYGVEIPNTNGRAGMSVVIPHEGQHIEPSDYADLLQFFKKELPNYAIPVFLRLQGKVETTGTFKYQKSTLKEESFNPAKVSDPILVWLPGTEAYTELTTEIYANIHKGEYRF